MTCVLNPVIFLFHPSCTAVILTLLMKCSLLYLIPRILKSL